MTNYKAVIFDLDGVITQTAKLHAKAWKKLFDEYLAGKNGIVPFDEHDDYLAYVDGKPRQDGVKSFLLSRSIDLPLGTAMDDPSAATCHGLGNLKDRYFKKLLRQNSPEVFEDALTVLNKWRELGLKMAIASSSKNCRQILEAANLCGYFEIRVDGTDLEKWGMPGKPAPDMFLMAARELGVSPSDCLLCEDAVSGVVAGKLGGFGLVVGVNRHGSDETLKRAGADIIVTHLTDIHLVPHVSRPGLTRHIVLSDDSKKKLIVKMG